MYTKYIYAAVVVFYDLTDYYILHTKKYDHMYVCLSMCSRFLGSFTGLEREIIKMICNVPNCFYLPLK